MTNGEKIQEIFKGCDVCEPIIEDNIIHVSFVDKNDSAIGFDWDWWNMEYKEPTAKNDLGVDCISRAEAIKCLECDFDITGKENMKTVVNYINSAHNKIVNLPRVKQEPILDKIRGQIKDYLRGVEITLEVLVENDPLRPKMEGAKSTLEECLELIDKAEKEL